MSNLDKTFRLSTRYSRNYRRIHRLRAELARAEQAMESTLRAAFPVHSNFAVIRDDLIMELVRNEGWGPEHATLADAEADLNTRLVDRIGDIRSRA